jgi:hypothetical protein
MFDFQFKQKMNIFSAKLNGKNITIRLQDPKSIYFYSSYRFVYSRRNLRRFYAYLNVFEVNFYQRNGIFSIHF